MDGVPGNKHERNEGDLSGDESIQHCNLILITSAIVSR